MWHIKKRFTEERDGEREEEREEELGNWRFILKIKRAEINEEKYFLQCSIKNRKKNEMKLKYFAIVK